MRSSFCVAIDLPVDVSSLAKLPHLVGDRLSSGTDERSPHGPPGPERAEGAAGRRSPDCGRDRSLGRQPLAQIGEHTGLDEYEVGNVITVTSLAGLSGGVVATWMGGRFGRKWPIVLGLGLNVIAAIGIGLTTSSLSYITFNLLWNAAYYFVVPYLMGAMAAMDDLGRWVVASDGIWTLGDAAGPAVAGTLVEWGGYPSLALLAMVGGLGCMLMLLRVLHRFESGEVPSAEGPLPPHPT
jgi:MFS family permease